MAKDKPAKYWRFKLDTRRKFTELSQEIARINSGGGGGGISELTSKMVVDALGYTPYNANNPANYITSAALTPYLKTEDAEETYATKDFVNNKLVNYAPLTSVQGFENRIGGLEGAVPRLNARVETVESKVATLNEYVVTGDNNLLNRVNAIEQEYATMTYVDNAIDGIDLSPYLLKADLTKSRIQSTLGISDWALAATKPSYAWSEITSRPTALSQFTDDVVAGKYLPSSGGNVASLTIGGNTAIHSGNIGSQFVEGIGTAYANQSINFGMEGKVRMIYVTASNATDLGYPAQYASGLSVVTGYTGWQMVTYGGTILPNPYFRKIADNGTWLDWKQLAFLDDNVASATKLATARTIWGQSFDGTGNVSGDINNAAGGICIHNTNEINSFQGKLYLNHRGSGLTDHGSTNDIVMVGNGGNVGIGTTSPTERLDVSGNIKADGNINATSITINGVTITASNGSITVNGNVFATGDITGYV